ncbi:NAD kinase [Glycocaulis profundi]|nr:NAD kinase [Glycocaulis profundi]
MRLAFHTADRPDARAAREAFAARHGEVALDEADVVVALGGDGVMLDALHRTISAPKPVYGLNFGSVGFLMNEPSDEDLITRIERAESAEIHPLRATGVSVQGNTFEALAINEVSLLRETRQSAKLRISIDGQVRMDELSADGALVATPAGSTAYNFSAHGPILPLDAQLLALTPISAFRPRRWRGALLRRTSTVRFEVLEAEKRPVAVVADNKEFREAREVSIREADDVALTMLFDPGRPLGERILLEQFTA